MQERKSEMEKLFYYDTDNAELVGVVGAIVWQYLDDVAWKDWERPVDYSMLIRAVTNQPTINDIAAATKLTIWKVVEGVNTLRDKRHIKLKLPADEYEENEPLQIEILYFIHEYDINQLAFDKANAAFWEKVKGEQPLARTEAGDDEE